MSQVLEPTTAATAPSTNKSGRPRPRPQVLLWGIAASLLLGGSGVVRSFQSNYYQEESTIDLHCPFPLSQIPKNLDGWHMIEGSAAVLDPMTTRITGSSDHILGQYVNDQTGATLSVMLLFGPAEPVLPHTPEVCYPSSGFVPVTPTSDQDVAFADGKVARFRSGTYMKPNGRNVLREIVFYSFRHDGVWVPWVSTKNSPRKNPGIFKLQIYRRLAPGEGQAEDEPIEEFVKQLLPILEQRISEPAASAPQVATTTP